MDEEKILQIEEGALACLPYQEGIMITRYRGIGRLAKIPETIDGLTVRAIAKKAFLSCKTLEEIILPDTIEEIGDWAFAHAESLYRVTIPRHEFVRGKELFLGCKRLHTVVLHGTRKQQQEDEQNGIGYMLAAAATVLHAYPLLDPVRLGTTEWVRSWDEKLMQLIHTDDLEGYEELWTCGEEDYEGKDYDIKSYPVEKRKMKVRMAYFRLLHPYKISESIREALEAYLKSHTKGTGEEEAWQVLIGEHPEDIAYYQIFTDAGCVSQDNFEGLLEDMQKVNAQMKAYMLRYREENLAKKDAFADFTLDW